VGMPHPPLCSRVRPPSSFHLRAPMYTHHPSTHQMVMILLTPLPRQGRVDILNLVREGGGCLLGINIASLLALETTLLAPRLHATPSTHQPSPHQLESMRPIPLPRAASQSAHYPSRIRVRVPLLTFQFSNLCLSISPAHLTSSALRARRVRPPAAAERLRVYRAFRSASVLRE
jgi:hypothetical protein